MDPPGINDPFAQLDEPRTFIKPNPGGGGRSPAGHLNPPSGDLQTGGVKAERSAVLLGEPLHAH